MKKLALILTLLFSLSLLAAGCGGTKQETQTDKPLKVGVTAGPHAEIMEMVKKVAEKDGLKIQIVEFNDYVQPNVALHQGDIDVNSYQHQPYLDNMIKDRQYDITSVAKTVIFPMGLYSQKVKSIVEVKSGAVVAIPNDPTNGGRALLLLESQGLIKLKSGAGILVSVADIAENPKNIKIRELDAAQIPRSLADMDLAAVNTNYAMTAGLVPTKDALALEDGNSPYANIVAVQSKNKDNPAVQKLLKAYQTDEVKKFIQEHFKGSVLVAW
ncbi:MetQ/NlpA family ABC transporter substrate-binding protein [Acetonema longum]|uniref:Lipoprotein n=1 Tax=Acetonema longum DSM 6540 TaxID=1009370 RepID=F7NEN2_9FIRM|nr:MetQ/NlpA family ABC transporter substrate-binding protein [Acetonema longum]EGO65443.1 lipoprotein YaeC [Acetonema longum DSM 6540]